MICAAATEHFGQKSLHCVNEPPSDIAAIGEFEKKFEKPKITAAFKAIFGDMSPLHGQFPNTAHQSLLLYFMHVVERRPLQAMLHMRRFHRALQESRAMGFSPSEDDRKKGLFLETPGRLIVLAQERVKLAQQCLQMLEP